MLPRFWECPETASPSSRDGRAGNTMHCQSSHGWYITSTSTVMPSLPSVLNSPGSHALRSLPSRFRTNLVPACNGHASTPPCPHVPTYGRPQSICMYLLPMHGICQCMHVSDGKDSRSSAVLGCRMPIVWRISRCKPSPYVRTYILARYWGEMLVSNSIPLQKPLHAERPFALTGPPKEPCWYLG